MPKKSKPLCAHGFPTQLSSCPECRKPKAEAVVDYGPKMNPRYWVGGNGYATMSEAAAMGKVMSKPKAAFYKTTFTFEVLSEEPLGDVGLADISEMCDSGPCVGRFGATKQRGMSPIQMADALVQFGSDPGFFNLDENGKRVD